MRSFIWYCSAAGPLSWSKWGQGEPKNADGHEDFIALKHIEEHGWGFDDVPADISLRCICKYEMIGGRWLIKVT